MSILSALKETQHNNNNLDDLAKLPQALIMQMAQNGQIPKDMVMPILGKKAEMVETAAKMKAAQALAAQGGAQPTVMEKYMGEIAQAENPAPAMPQQQMQQPMPQQMAQSPMPQGPEDVGIASQATAPMSMAGGGIIAFEGGGDVEDDEDYQEMRDDAQEAAMNDKLYEMIAGLKGGDATENRGVGITAGRRGAERGMEDKGDLESRLRAIIMQKESGGKRYDKAGNILTSSKGAQGEMQVMPGTAKDPGFGIKAAQNNSPDELRRVGDEYASVLLNRYQDPKLAMIAYNMGPGATDKWLSAGADIRKLPKETRQYIQGVNLAGGGEVKHYAAGGYEDTQYDPMSGLPVSGYETYMERPAEREMPSDFFMDQPWQRKAAKEQGKKVATTKPAAPARGKASPEEVEQFFSRYDNIPVKGNAPQIPQSPEGIKALQAKADDENFNLMNYIKAREAKMDAAEKKDLALAGLAAGLGMLGGTSQYAFENIGKGGQMGVQQLAQSQKTRAAQEAAMGKLYGSASQTELMNKLRRDQLAQGKELKEDQLSQNLLKAKNDFIQKRMKERGMDEMMLGTLKRQQAMGKLDPAKLPELNYYEKQMRDIETDANRMFASPSAGSGMRIVGVRG
jgi:hypothetical protein